MPSERTNNFPESGRGLGHMTPTIFGSTVGYPSDSLASCYRSNGMYKRDYAFRMNAMEEIFQIRSCIEWMDGWLGLNGILSTQVAAVVDEVSLIIICKDSK